MLSVVAVLAAWSGFSAAKWSTESSVRLAEASSTRTKASRVELEAIRSAPSTRCPSTPRSPRSSPRTPSLSPRRKSACARDTARFRRMAGDPSPDEQQRTAGSLLYAAVPHPSGGAGRALRTKADERFKKARGGRTATSTSVSPSSLRPCSSSSASAATSRATRALGLITLASGLLVLAIVQLLNCRGRRAEAASYAGGLPRRRGSGRGSRRRLAARRLAVRRVDGLDGRCGLCGLCGLDGLDGLGREPLDASSATDSMQSASFRVSSIRRVRSRQMRSASASNVRRRASASRVVASAWACASATSRSAWAWARLAIASAFSWATRRIAAVSLPIRSISSRMAYSGACSARAAVSSFSSAPMCSSTAAGS